MKIIHELCCNKLFQEETEFKGVFDWTEKEWQQKLTEEGCCLNDDGEIEHSHDEDDEYVSLYRKVKEGDKNLCPYCKKDLVKRGSEMTMNELTDVEKEMVLNHRRVNNEEREKNEAMLHLLDVASSFMRWSVLNSKGRDKTFDAFCNEFGYGEKREAMKSREIYQVYGFVSSSIRKAEYFLLEENK